METVQIGMAAGLSSERSSTSGRAKNLPVSGLTADIFADSKGQSTLEGSAHSADIPNAYLYKEIPLTRGRVALVSPEDYDWLIEYRWTALVARSGRVYAVRFQNINGKRCCFYMHRQIMGEPVGLQVDHRDRDGLHNWRENLREATPQQNCANSMRPENTTGFKGVFAYGNRGWFRAMIMIDGRMAHLGCSPSKIVVAQLYDAAAVARFGEYALTNFRQPDASNTYLYDSPDSVAELGGAA